MAQRPETPPPIRSWRACSLALARGRRVAASARAPQPAHHRSSHRQQGLSPTLRFPGLSFPFREMGSHLGRWDAENTWGGEAAIVMSLFFLCLSFPASEALQRPSHYL